MIVYLYVRFDLFYEVGLGLSANQLVNDLAVLYEQDSGNAGYAIVDGQLRVVVDIHFTYVDLAIIFF